MKFIADFHLHSKYSRATGQETDLEHLTQAAKEKGISLLGTGDFTHPAWLYELKTKLKPVGRGLFEYRQVFFILTTEVCNLFREKEEGKKIHNLIFSPSFEIVDKINFHLAKYGNLTVDGRPMLNLSARDFVKMMMGISEEIIIIPGHIWTPWFSLFGSRSGFDQIEDCFGDQTKYIFALETGLSSDPAMNWRWSKLDSYILISNSDAHSPTKLGREANVFSEKVDYFEIKKILQEKDREKFLFTIEFFPEEGKYHFDGHRRCQVRFSPQQTYENKNICPVCHGPLTIGVMNRVESLSDRPPGYQPPQAIPFKRLIPLKEIIAEARKVGVDTETVKAEYKNLIENFGPEFSILLDLPKEQLNQNFPQKIAEGIINVREEKVEIIPGYDGNFGKIKVIRKEEKHEMKQMSLFDLS
jgi:uncharacterized protein (TIGR00375 family)